MRLQAIEVRQLEIPMIEPMAYAQGSVNFRRTIYVRVITDVGEGWGECIALMEPTYAPDWSNGEYAVLCDVFVPALLKRRDIIADDVTPLLAQYRMHNMAKSAIEMAVFDAELRHDGKSLAQHFGALNDSVECIVIIGLYEGDALLSALQRQLDRGFRHVKLKVRPDDADQRVDLVRSAYPNLELRVDANCLFDWNDADHRAMLHRLDERNLLSIEQPFEPDRARPFIEAHKELNTPIAIDESLSSLPRLLNVLEQVECDQLIIKPAMLGGYNNALKALEAARAANVPVSVGGIVESPLSRAANLAFAAVCGGDIPAEISPDGRWFSERLNQDPVLLHNGRIDVPIKSGLGVELDMATLERLTRRVHLAK